MKKLLVLGCALAISTTVFAGQRDFHKLDKDADSKLSQAEFLVHIKADKQEKMKKIFANRDKNSDGFLTQDEYKIKQKKK